VFLLCLTFFMTIFGTFLTRSGLIASVHSFARSSIGNYFVVFMVILAVGCAALIIWRLPLLRAEHRIDSLLSRDFAFLLNNWILMGMLLFVLIATTWPLISEALRGQTVTVGPAFYNKWMVPLGLILMALTGIGPLLAWRKSNKTYLVRAMIAPGAASLLVAVLHISIGGWLGYPAIVHGEDIYDTMTGRVLASIYGAAPLLSTAGCTFVLVGHLQEFWRGTRARMRNAKEGIFVAFFELIARSKRRYGGYMVHLGLIAMYFGFTGSAYDNDKEQALKPGESLTVRGYEVRYDGSRMVADPGKRMVFSDMTVLRDGEPLTRIAPAKFIYEKPQGTTTTEVAIRSTLAADVYAIMNSVNPDTKVGTFRVIVRPFVAWIWLGGLLMIFGTAVSMAPSVSEVLGEARERARFSRFAGAASTATIVGILALALLLTVLLPVLAHAQTDSSSSLHAGTVTMHSPEEKQLFERLLCECGDCQRLPLSSCICSWAEKARARIREDIAAGKTALQVQQEYREEHGAQAIAIPSDKGMDRALWAVPIAVIAGAALLLVRWGRRWSRGADAPGTLATAPAGDAASSDARYDAALERELERLDDKG
jgi:cytochrome c-type biogenesis protein CcmF